MAGSETDRSATPHAVVASQAWFPIVLGAWIGAVCGALLVSIVFCGGPVAVLRDVRLASQFAYDDLVHAARIVLPVHALLIAIGGIGGSALGAWAVHRGRQGRPGP
jgi:uncharacterized membrane protein YfcA